MFVHVNLLYFESLLNLNIEFHTKFKLCYPHHVLVDHRQAESFQELWTSLGDSIDKLRLVAVSIMQLTL